jgi:hypothetical protein
VTKPPEPAWLFTTAKIFKAYAAIAIQLAGTRDFLAGLHGKAASKPEPSGTGADIANSSKAVRQVESDPSCLGNLPRKPTFYRFGRMPQFRLDADE